MAQGARCSLVKQAEAHVLILFLLFRLLLLRLLGFLCSCATASSRTAAATAAAAAHDSASDHHLCRVCCHQDSANGRRLQPICLSSFLPSLTSSTAAPAACHQYFWPYCICTDGTPQTLHSDCMLCTALSLNASPLQASWTLPLLLKHMLVSAAISQHKLL